jgi:hypothetical protein
MIELPHASIPPYQHQLIGVDRIVNNPYFFLADEMGAGKTKQTIDAACYLFEQNVIDKVLVICPAAVRPVWFHPEYGELKKHLWKTVTASVTEFHQKMPVWRQDGLQSRRMRWVITNYDYIRKGFEGKGKKKKPIGKLADIMAFCDARTLLVLDESSAVAHHTSQQTKACYAIRQRCGRVLLLNGTPITHSPADLYSQGNILNYDILLCKSFVHFRARYAKMGGWENKVIVGWIEGAIEDLQRRFKPYTLRRLKKDCIDLPEKLPPVVMLLALTPQTWKIYKAMRDDLVAWLSDNTVATASLAFTKVLRLAQITSGFVGGIEDAIPQSEDAGPAPSWLPYEHAAITAEVNKPIEILVGPGVAQIGTEKLDHYTEFLTARLEEKPSLKSLCWCQFLPEVHQTVEHLRNTFSGMEVAALCGSNTRAERERVLRLLDPRTAPAGPVTVVGTTGTGAMGLNLTAAEMNWYRSLGRSLRNLLQSQDRTHRPGQVNAVSYFYQIATGPNGQKTIDHAILKSLTGQLDIATMTASAWVKELTEE